MKKFIPYIFITAFAGVFLTLSFSASFSGQKEVEAGVISETRELWNAGQYWALLDPAATALGSAVIDALTLKGIIWGEGGIIDSPLGWVVSEIANLISSLAARLFILSAMLLDKVVIFSVVDFKANIERIGVIDQGYKMVLNVANMIFIFILLYIAINTILGIGGGNIKKLLTNIIVVALLINFSLFMTKVIIDASNIVALQFYYSTETVFGETADGKNQIVVGSIASAFASGLRMQTIIYKPISIVIKDDPKKGLDYFSITLNFLWGAALSLIASFVFISISILFVVRFIALLFYMIFSPVAFLGYILPELQTYSKKWWAGFQSQAMFAPAFLFVAYLVSSIINSGKLWSAVGGNDTATTTFYEAVQSGFVTGFPIMMNYVILISLMIGGLIAAKSMASVGSAGMVGYGDKFRGWAQGVAGRNTVGRLAYIAGGTNAMKRAVSRSPIFGGFAKKQFDSMAGASFGGAKGGYSKALKDSVEQKRKTAEWLKYKGKDTETMEKNIEEEKKAQKRRDDAMPGLKEKTAATKQKYDEAEKEREKWQKEYDTFEDAESKEGLERAKEKAKSAKQDFEREQGRLEIEETKTKESKKTIENAEEKLKETQSKWKTAYRENLKFDSNALNKLFPSGAKAAEEIRKGKSKDEKVVAEMLEKIAEEKAKEAGGETPKGK